MGNKVAVGKDEFCWFGYCSEVQIGDVVPDLEVERNRRVVPYLEFERSRRSVINLEVERGSP